MTNGDGRRADCTTEECGDGILDPGEDVMMATPQMAIGCTAVCTAEETDQPPLCVPTPDCCGTECEYEWPLVLNPGFETISKDDPPTGLICSIVVANPVILIHRARAFPGIEVEEGYGNVFQLSRPQREVVDADLQVKPAPTFGMFPSARSTGIRCQTHLGQSLSGGGHYNNEFPIIYRVFYVADEPDTDGDGLPDSWELVKYNTDPEKVDTDENGIPDGD